MKKIIFILLVSAIGKTFAQSGSPYLNIGNDTTLYCADSCIQLHADYTHIGSTNAYTVTQIPYSPLTSFNSGSPIIIGVDDRWSALLPMPFAFCFFGTTYTNAVVGSNSILTFDGAAGGGFCNWSLTQGTPIPTTVYGVGTTNAVMAAYQDIDPTFQGLISWQVIDAAPNRKFVVNYFQVPYFGDPNSVSTGWCGTALFFTAQIVLYETTNVIDIIIQNKPDCPAWNQGRAIEGIQNSTGTVAYAVPGRNNTVFTTTNDAWRFTPSGSIAQTSVDWYSNSTWIATSDSVTVCIDSVETITARVTYPQCSVGPVVVSDSIVITHAGQALTLSNSVADESCTGCNDGSVMMNVTGGNGPYTYTIMPNAGTLNGNTFSNLSSGAYYVCATDAGGCTACDSVYVGVSTGVEENGMNAFSFVSIYPMPAHNTFIVECKMKNSAHGWTGAELKIYDVTGRIVYEQILNSQVSTINCPLYPELYIVKVSVGQKSFTKKLVVE
jgi:hypothetical protein